MNRMGDVPMVRCTERCRGPLADADGLGRVGHADWLGQMLADPALERGHGRIALGRSMCPKAAPAVVMPALLMTI